MQLVESVPLLVNNKANDYIGVNLYVDDTGSIKGLPINVRASAVCRTCGHIVEVCPHPPQPAQCQPFTDQS